MSYLEYYGLKKEPFSNAPVSQFYFNSPTHSQALARLTYAVSQSKGLALLMGEAGAGKTTLARRLLDTLAEDQYEAALLVIIHSGITAGWLLKRIAVQLGVEKPAEEKLALLGQLYQRLLAIHEQGKKAVVLIDEAQMLQTREIMEEFRGLLNLELPEQKLLTFILFGLPEMEQYLTLDPPLHQRVALKIRLTSLNAESTEAYIKHRLKLAGATRMPFSAEAVRAINRFAQGIPRVVNTLCDNCLFEGFLAKLNVVNEKLVHRSAADLGLTLGPETTAASSQPTPSAPPAAPAPRPQSASPAPAPPTPTPATGVATGPAASASPAPQPAAAPPRPPTGAPPRPGPVPVRPAASPVRTPGPVAAGTAEGQAPQAPRPAAPPRPTAAPLRPPGAAVRPLAVAVSPSSGPRPVIARPAHTAPPVASSNMTALRPPPVAAASAPSRPPARPPPAPSAEPSAAAEMADLERFLTGTDKA